MPCSAWFIRTAAMSAGLAIRQQPWPWMHVDRPVKHRGLRLRCLAQEAGLNSWRRLLLLLMVVVLVGSACQLMQGVPYPHIKSAIAVSWSRCSMDCAEADPLQGKRKACSVDSEGEVPVYGLAGHFMAACCARRRVCLSRRITQAHALQH